ncbi:hypothetical protein [Flavobacterium muglaense]|uniref:Uncharacterized protein n=1 Tax=Flavobacterium muglaense TaxID=2764716 RepID=A0A923N1K6_9FLAO|nr:hypothetical protein [Flavobacterium muglaense]MBC5839201.1 hypothetical protein [Flavobacterium muglaense]MBC5845676.1 hypothetical protein [Flavobacterium muglaense]
MRIFQNKFYLTFLLLLGFMDLVAGAKPSSGPPSPTGKGAAGPVTPPGLPIDGNLVLLFVAAVLLGIYIIYIRPIKVKAST